MPSLGVLEGVAKLGKPRSGGWFTIVGIELLAALSLYYLPHTVVGRRNRNRYRVDSGLSWIEKVARPDARGDGLRTPPCRPKPSFYRFTWRSSFDYNAVVRIGRHGDEITLRWVDRWFRTPSPDDAPPVVALTLADWARLQDALIAASFWALGPEESRLGLDGSDWLIEGRRKDIFRAVSRWSPRGALRDLGKLFFELAGPPLAEVRIY
jgi:hypothetical protein